VVVTRYGRRGPQHLHCDAHDEQMMLMMQMGGRVHAGRVGATHRRSASVDASPP
jgi:hypothetical protein